MPQHVDIIFELKLHLTNFDLNVAVLKKSVKFEISRKKTLFYVIK